MSQKKFETQIGNARSSQYGNETQYKSAPASQDENETQYNLARPEALRLMVEGFWDIQEARKKLSSALSAYKTRGVEEMYLEEVQWFVDELKEVEREAQKKFNRLVELHPITDWMRRIKGVDLTYIAQLVAVIRDIRRFPTVSKLWKYMGWGAVLRCQNKKCGKRLFESAREKEEYVERMVERLRDIAKRRKYRKKGQPFSEEEAREKVLGWCCKCSNPKPKYVAQRRRRGELCDFNPDGKKIMGRIAVSIVRLGKTLSKRGKTPPRYYQFMEKHWEAYKKRPDLAGKPLHAFRLGVRVMVKLILAHVWEVWRRALGLEVKPAYAVEKRGEKYISPWEMIDITD